MIERATLLAEGSDFDAVIAWIEAHGGDLIKFGGDALTAFFDADLLGPNHASWAVGAAQIDDGRSGPASRRPPQVPRPSAT